jgi:hypothetical protein
MNLIRSNSGTERPNVPSSASTISPRNAKAAIASKENAGSIDLVLKIMRAKRAELDKAIAALEQLRPMLTEA